MPPKVSQEWGIKNKKESDLRADFLYQVANIPGGEKIKKCIQCGTCTGSCPVSYTMDIMPREIIALFRAGLIESILHSRTIWICASCYACTVRCPAGIKVTDILYALKRMAMEKGLFPKRFPIFILSKSFVYLINLFGRSYEPGLLILYYLRTNPLKLFSLMPLAFKLFRKGRLALLPKSIKKRKELSAILAEAEVMEMIVPERPYLQAIPKGPVPGFIRPS
ncbi:MAG: 4Fe-4S dicluster domain-containing protein [Candidatus Aminicenantes bacterium]|nr:4Fe-4S dicluster domain-containing protein [Candidatus Aminicenantes bacterium]